MVFHGTLCVGGNKIDENGYGTKSLRERMSLVVFIAGMR